MRIMVYLADNKIVFLLPEKVSISIDVLGHPAINYVSSHVGALNASNCCGVC